MPVARTGNTYATLPGPVGERAGVARSKSLQVNIDLGTGAIRARVTDAFAADGRETASAGRCPAVKRGIRDLDAIALRLILQSCLNAEETFS